MSFQHIAFLFFRTRFFTIFYENCCRGEGLRTTTCLNTVVGCKQGHATFLCESYFMEIIRLSPSFWILPKLRPWCLVSVLFVRGIFFNNAVLFSVPFAFLFAVNYSA